MHTEPSHTTVSQTKTLSIQDEWDLAKYIYEEWQKGKDTITYTGDAIEDLAFTAEILGCVLPFDVALYQTSSFQQKENVIKLENLDPYFEESERMVQELLEQEKQAFSTTLQKLKWMHDTIILRTEYDEATQPVKNSYWASGAFLEKKAVCSGYSRAFMMFAQAEEIPVLYVSSERMNHGWNYVYDGEEWVFVDVTWDDALFEQEVQDTYFAKRQDAFFQDGKHELKQQEMQFLLQVKEVFFNDF